MAEVYGNNGIPENVSTKFRTVATSRAEEEDVYTEQPISVTLYISKWSSGELFKYCLPLSKGLVYFAIKKALEPSGEETKDEIFVAKRNKSS